MVGEVRAGEALDMLQAMNTGHEGSLSTCHANGPVEAVARLETMVLMGDVELPHAAVREQVVSAVDLVVHIARQPRRWSAGGGRLRGRRHRRRRPGAACACWPTVPGDRRCPTRPPRSGLAGDAHPDWIGR